MSKSDSWMEKFEELKEYHKSYGHFPRMPPQTSKRNLNSHTRLGIWFHNQCGSFRDGKMNDHRRLLMNRTFGDWMTPGITRDEAWVDKFNQLKDFYDKEKCFPDRITPLGGWLHTQRKNSHSKKKGTMTAERRRMMDSAFSDWITTSKEENQKTWLDKFNEVLELYKKTGRLPKYTTGEKKMASWIESQRQAVRGLIEVS